MLLPWFGNIYQSDRIVSIRNTGETEHSSKSELPGVNRDPTTSMISLYDVRTHRLKNVIYQKGIYVYTVPGTQYGRVPRYPRPYTVPQVLIYSWVRTTWLTEYIFWPSGIGPDYNIW